MFLNDSLAINHHLHAWLYIFRPKWQNTTCTSFCMPFVWSDIWQEGLKVERETWKWVSVYKKADVTSEPTCIVYQPFPRNKELFTFFHVSEKCFRKTDFELKNFFSYFTDWSTAFWSEVTYSSSPKYRKTWDQGFFPQSTEVEDFQTCSSWSLCWLFKLSPCVLPKMFPLRSLFDQPNSGAQRLEDQIREPENIMSRKVDVAIKVPPDIGPAYKALSFFITLLFSSKTWHHFSSLYFQHAVHVCTSWQLLTLLFHPSSFSTGT